MNDHRETLNRVCIFVLVWYVAYTIFRAWERVADAEYALAAATCRLVEVETRLRDSTTPGDTKQPA